MENYHLSIHMASWKESMINRLSNLINRNRSAAIISHVLCSSNHVLFSFPATPISTGIEHKHMLFLCCGLPCASSDYLVDQRTLYILNKCGLSLHCGWAYAVSDDLVDQMTSGILNKCASFLQCGSVYDSPFSCSFGLGWIWKHLTELRMGNSTTDWHNQS